MFVCFSFFFPEWFTVASFGWCGKSQVLLLEVRFTSTVCSASWNYIWWDRSRNGRNWGFIGRSCRACWWISAKEPKLLQVIGLIKCVDLVFLLIPKIIAHWSYESNEKKNCRSEVCFSILCILWIWILIPTIWFTNLWTLTTSKKDCWIISQDCQDNSTISLVIFPIFYSLVWFVIYLLSCSIQTFLCLLKTWIWNILFIFYDIFLFFCLIDWLQHL